MIISKLSKFLFLLCQSFGISTQSICRFFNYIASETSETEETEETDETVNKRMFINDIFEM